MARRQDPARRPATGRPGYCRTASNAANRGAGPRRTAHAPTAVGSRPRTARDVSIATARSARGVTLLQRRRPSAVARSPASFAPAAGRARTFDDEDGTGRRKDMGRLGSINSGGQSANLPGDSPCCGDIDRRGGLLESGNGGAQLRGGDRRRRRAMETRRGQHRIRFTAPYCSKRMRQTKEPGRWRRKTAPARLPSPGMAPEMTQATDRRVKSSS